MPIDVAEYLKTPTPPGGPPAAPPSKLPTEASTSPGLDIDKFLESQPKPPTIAEKLKPAALKIKEIGGIAYTQQVKPFVDDAIKWANDYASALHEDMTSYPQGTANQLLQSLKTANDALGYVAGPIMAPLYTGFINPAKAALDKLGEQITKVASDNEYRAQEKREGQRGQQYPKGVDWKIHKEDVLRTVDGLKDSVEFAANIGVGLLGGPKAEHVPVERPAAQARAALQDIKEATAPKEPVLKPVAVSLDKTMGFGKVVENVKLQDLPAGSNRTAASILDEMIPHAEGYAQSFLTKLKEHIEPNMPVMFKNVAGFSEKNLGAYIPDYHQVQIRAGSSDIVHTTIHEMVHGATVNTLDNLIEGEMQQLKTSLGRDLKPTEVSKLVDKPTNSLLRELDQIIKEARIRAEKAGRVFKSGRMKDYGLMHPEPIKGFPLSEEGMSRYMESSASKGNLEGRAFARMSPRYEFVAELFSSSELQEFLANSEKYASVGYKWKNMLNQFGNMIGRHLGMTNQAELRLLNQSMRVGTRLLQMNPEKGTGRSISQIVARTEDGGTITRGDINRVTEIARLVDDQAVRRGRESLKISIEQILRGVSPESLSERAKLAAAAISSRITEQMQKAAFWQHGSMTRQNFWRARPDFTREFIRKFEKGEAFSDPVMDKLAKKYREWGERIATRDAKLGLDYEARDNYLAHIFEDTEGAASYFIKKYGSKWGDPSFIKDRSFDLYEEAVAAGFRPRFDNPEDIMLARQHASDIAEMHIGIMNDLASYGLAVRKVVGEERIVKDIDAEGKVTFRVEKTEGTKRPEGTVRWRAPNGDVFWVDAHADAILQNAFKSKSLWGDRGALGVGFRGMMGLKNALVPIRLALSAFHPLHVMGIDMAAGFTRGITGMLSGTVPTHKAFGEMLKSGLGYRALSEIPGVRAVTNPPGWRVLQALRGKIPAAKLTENDAHALRTLIEMGISPEMSAQYRTNARQNFMNALRDAQANFRQVKVGGAAGDLVRATWHLPWAAISAMSKPIFEEWIPALKAASALKDAAHLLQRNPELIENDAARHLAMRKLGKSVENRYGEMNYGTLFWKRWVKDVAVLDTLSLGWQLGFIREYGGGALDLGQWAAKGEKLEQIRKGQLDKPIFVASYTTLGAGVAGLMTYAMTGQPPQGILDYIDPRTGETNPDGTPQRVTTMFYSREFAAVAKHMQNEGVLTGLSQAVMNKGSGLFGLMHEWATGVNGFGQEIRDPDSDVFKKIEQTVAYSMADLEPISMKSLQENVTDKPLKAGTLSVLGFTPAPKYLTESKTDADIKSAFRSYVAPRETPFEKAEYSKEYSQLREAYQSGSDKYGDMLDKMTEKYELSGTDQRRLMRSLNSTLPPTVRMFMRLPWQEQKKILDKSTPEEVDLLLPHSNKEHVRNVWTPPEPK